MAESWHIPDYTATTTQIHTHTHNHTITHTHKHTYTHTQPHTQPPTPPTHIHTHTRTSYSPTPVERILLWKLGSGGACECNCAVVGVQLCRVRLWVAIHSKSS